MDTVILVALSVLVRMAVRGKIVFPSEIFSERSIVLVCVAHGMIVSCENFIGLSLFKMICKNGVPPKLALALIFLIGLSKEPSESRAISLRV